jgi:hypothetical protein
MHVAADILSDQQLPKKWTMHSPPQDHILDYLQQRCKVSFKFFP